MERLAIHISQALTQDFFGGVIPLLKNFLENAARDAYNTYQRVTIRSRPYGACQEKESEGSKMADTKMEMNLDELLRVSGGAVLTKEPTEDVIRNFITACGKAGYTLEQALAKWREVAAFQYRLSGEEMIRKLWK